LYEIIKNNIQKEFVKPVYSRVILPLKALVEGDFFNEYIKKGILIFFAPVSIPKKFLTWQQGNILMLSEGRPGVDNVYSLKEGIANFFASCQTGSYLTMGDSRHLDSSS
jgi:ribonuclease P/MRP protein subunit RPP40